MLKNVPVGGSERCIHKQRRETRVDKKKFCERAKKFVNSMNQDSAGRFIFSPHMTPTSRRAGCRAMPIFPVFRVLFGSARRGHTEIPSLSFLLYYMLRDLFLLEEAGCEDCIIS